MMIFKYSITLWICAAYLMRTVFNSEYLGCYSNEELKLSNDTLASLTPKTCSDECLVKNYIYAAYNRMFCRCTNNYMSKLTKEMNDNCNSNVSRNGYNILNKKIEQMYFKIKNTSEENYPQAIYLGCYREKTGDDNNRLLKFPHERYSDNSPQKCAEECFKIGFLYSGLTNGEIVGTACWCGNQYPSNKFKIDDSKCDVICPGDKTKYCGGFWKLSVYSTGIIDYPLGMPIGCFKLDLYNTHGKKIQNLKETKNSHRCFYICNERGYKYTAVSEDYCECSNEKPNDEMKQEECKKCEDDETEYCGGSRFISVYENNWFGKVSGDLNKRHFGCFKNSWMYPIMEGWNLSFPLGLTSQTCVSSCYAREYPYAALVSSNECLCSFVSSSLEAKLDERHCNSTCSGGSERECGDHSRYNVFTTGIQTSRVAGHYYMGCYKEWKDHNMKNELHSFNTPNMCSRYCDKAGFRYFGISYRTHCWCGNVPPDEKSKDDDRRCSVQCSGDANKYCGGVSNTAVFQIGMVADIIYNCSTVCDCYFFPKINVSTINCSKNKLIESPNKFPVFENTTSSVNFILKNNFIKVLPSLMNLNITLLDISYNNITNLYVNPLPKSLKVLYINNNQLTTFDDSLLMLLKSLDKITLSNNPWPCECDLRFIILKYKSKIIDLNDITCVSSTQPLIYMDEYNLCKKWTINYFYMFIILGFVLFICILSIYFNLHKTVWLYLHNIQCNISDVQTDNNKDSSEIFMQRIQYNELVLATDNWSRNNILGEGGFGVVYKGNWRHTDVAIKRLKANGVAEKVVNMHTLGDELLSQSNEIMYLNAVKHDNILSMYGFCFHTSGSCLIYQYMANGSLEDRLQRKNGTTSMSWHTRGNIALGTARGLQFLHNMETPLIHGDIKSANILLDSNFEPRIGDFGLARIGPIEVINKNVGFNVSRVCGTKPYLPDDFCANKKLSTKVDTYSFGVVMFEIATGLRAFNRYKNYKYLKELVNMHDNSSLSEIADKTAGQDSFDVFKTLISLGKKCVVDKSENRPEMVVVYMNLQNIMSLNTNPQQGAVVINYDNRSSSVQLKVNHKTENHTFPFKHDGLKNLEERKAALLAPLDEIPSISTLYSSPTHKIDTRKIVTTEQKLNADEMMSEGFFTTDF